MRASVGVLCLLLCVLTSGTRVQADNEFNTGDDWKPWCEHEADYMAFACMSYIYGVFQTHELITGGERRLFCNPPGATNGQLFDIVRKYMRANPNTLHKPFVAIVLAALADAFPCPGAPVAQ